MKKNYLEILFRMHMGGIPISLRSIPSRLLEKKMNIIESVAHFKGKDIYSYGASCISKDIAHAKCVAETVERLFVPHFEEGGIGVGFDKECASLAALYELIERDAFMPYFLLEDIPIRPINIKHVELELNKFGIGKLPLNYTCMFFDITNDLGIPSMATCVRKKRTGLISVGIKSNIDPAIALCGSLEEALLEITLKEKYGRKKKIDARNLFSMKHFKSNFIDKENFLISNFPPNIGIDTSFKSASAYIHKLGQSIIFEEKTPLLLKNSAYHIITATSDTLQKVFFTAKRINVNKKRLENIERYYTIMKLNYEKNHIHI